MTNVAFAFSEQLPQFKTACSGATRAFFALKPTVSQSIRVQAAYETSAPASFYCAIG
jgi:hypothetical protein